MKNIISTFAFVLMGIVSQSLFAQASFDGDIKNNSLALSHDGRTAVASYSDSTQIKVYDVTSGKWSTRSPGLSIHAILYSHWTTKRFLLLTVVSGCWFWHLVFYKRRWDGH